MDEFGRIARFFRPLTQGFPAACNLVDDAAFLTPPAGYDLVITKDAICEGVHFLGTEPAGLIARKLLRVNLSDLATKGAQPYCYFLAIMLPKDTPETWIAAFAEGLAQDQQEFGLHLAGGDSTATLGLRCFTLTALGLVPQGKALLRSGAKPGDLLYVSGTLGDSAAGLLSLRAQRSNPANAQEDWIAASATPPRNDGIAFLQHRYLLPQPRLKLGSALRGIASACMDISDGLVQDSGHLCAASGCGAVIEENSIPLSPAFRDAASRNPALRYTPLNGGDDYELLFTVAPDRQSLIPPGCTLIGRITEGSGVTVLDSAGNPVALEYTGYRHF